MSKGRIQLIDRTVSKYPVHYQINQPSVNTQIVNSQTDIHLVHLMLPLCRFKAATQIYALY